MSLGRFPAVNRALVSCGLSDVKLAAEFPSHASTEMPTIAIITSMFCEKMAVDAMLDSKVTYIKHVPDASTPGNWLSVPRNCCRSQGAIIGVKSMYIFAFSPANIRIKYWDGGTPIGKCRPTWLPV